MGFYEGQDGPAVVKSAKSGTNGFKKGGSCMKKGGKVFSEAARRVALRRSLTNKDAGA
jgi:hypothetical protein